MPAPRLPVRWKPTLRRDEAQDRRWFQKLVRRRTRSARFVVGLPVHLDGRESQNRPRPARFGRWLAEISGVARRILRRAIHDSRRRRCLCPTRSLTKKKRKARLDKLAAQIMLTAYLEKRRANPEATDEPCADWTNKQYQKSLSENSRDCPICGVPGANWDCPLPSSRTGIIMSKLIFGCGYLGGRVAALVAPSRCTRCSSSRARSIAPVPLTPTDIDRSWPTCCGRKLWPNFRWPTPCCTRSATIAPSGASMHDVYVDGLQSVLVALPSNTGKFIYISSTGVYGQSHGESVDEDSPCEPTREGGRACLAAEALVGRRSLGKSRASCCGWPACMVLVEFPMRPRFVAAGRWPCRHRAV